MRLFNFRKTTRRNQFTTIFGGIGQRRSVFINRPRSCNVNKRTKMNKIRRAHQGWRNKTIGMLNALKIRRLYGRHKPTTAFRR